MEGGGDMPTVSQTAEYCGLDATAQQADTDTADVSTLRNLCYQEIFLHKVLEQYTQLE